MIGALVNRVVSDYFIRNRIAQYEQLLRIAIEEGYAVMTHRDYVAAIRSGNKLPSRVLLVRHDIDTDPDFCYQWLQTEKKLGVHTSYFFRLSTARSEVMKAVIDSGSECGYHFEELASFAKDYRIRKAEDVILHIEAIRERFKLNLHQMCERIGEPIVSVVSHGDFVNRQIKLSNHAIIDANFLNDCMLEYEGYDPAITGTYSANISDHVYPTFYRGKLSPVEALRKHLPVIHLLVHPRHWRSSWYWNTRENVLRFVEGWMFRFLPTKKIMA